MKALVIVLVALSLLAAACSPGARAVAPQSKTARASFLRPCRVPEFEAEAWCGKYEVFEDRRAGRGRKVGLNVVVLPAAAEKPAPDPVFFFAGGPGQGASGLAGFLGGGPMAKLRRERDLVFFDQRGTGESNPLACPAPADDDLRGYFEELFPAREVRACRERLEKVADLRQYTTTAAVEDLDELRRALGYDKINLYGGSYGTTMALAYLRQHRGAARAVVLAGVAPTSLKLPLPFARGAQHAWDGLVRDCAADADCRAAFPNLGEELRAVLSRLDKGPASVEIVNPLTKKPQRLNVTRGPFTERLRLLLYDQGSASLVPLLIHRAAAGDFKPFVLVALPRAIGLYQSLALGMYYTVTCAEDVPFITDDDVRRETGGTFIGDYRVRVHREACREWPRADVPKGFTREVESDAPVLLLSGELDPASPHWLGAEVVRHLPNGLQATVPRGAHGYFNACISDIAAEFVARGSVRGLDTSCLAAAKRPPFVIKLPEDFDSEP